MCTYVCLFKELLIAAHFPPAQPLGTPREGEFVHTTSELVTFNNLAPLRVRSNPPARQLYIEGHETMTALLFSFF